MSPLAVSTDLESPEFQFDVVIFDEASQVLTWDAILRRYRAITNRTQTADLHATILHQLGLDHEQLTFNHNSLDERLTDVYKAHVIQELVG